jgi:hypothetical protein
MKLEIEITEEEIKSAIERKVRVAVADQSNSWSIDNEIKAKVKSAIPAAIDALITEALSNSERLKLQILEETEKAIKRKLQAAMKLKDDGK